MTVEIELPPSGERRSVMIPPIAEAISVTGGTVPDWSVSASEA